MTATLGFRSASVRRLRRLLERRAARQEEQAFVVEGHKLLAEALAAGAPVEELFVAPGAAEEDEEVVAEAVATGANVRRLAEGVLERASATVTPQPIAAIVGRVDVALQDLEDADFVVVCVDVRDPGNLGTVLRSAQAAGAGGVVCCDGSVDVYGPKTVRASAGSLFHVPIVAGGEPVEVLERMGVWGMRRLGTQARRGEPYDRADLASPIALVLGNEAHGLPAELGGVLDGTVSIPMTGQVESLNVGMAAAVLCFEAARQRRLAR